MENLPDKVERHHRLNVRERYDPIIRFCTEELQIPVGNLVYVTPVSGFDQYQIRVRSGYTFIVSGQEISLWENNPICSPER